MSTNIRPEVSKKNKYYIPKHRYYELKHFCLQYDDFKKMYNSALEEYGKPLFQDFIFNYETSDPTYQAYLKAKKYDDRIRIIEECAAIAGSEIAKYILMAVTKKYSYNYLHMQKGLPCCKEVFYDMYRKFFWLLDQKRD